MKSIIKINMIRFLRIVISIVASYVLFAIIPFAHLFFNVKKNEGSKSQQQKTVIMQRIEKEEKKPNTEIKRIRKVAEKGKKTKSRSFSMKITPNLGVGSSNGVSVENRNLENFVFEEGDTEEAPIPVSRMAIPYPRRAKEAGIEGMVSLIIIIDRKGRVAQVDFKSVPSPLFKKPIEQIVKKWRFKPARHKGVPVRVRVRQNIKFSLS